MSENKKNKKSDNIIAVSFKQTEYDQKLKNDILVDSANVGVSAWIKHVSSMYLYSGGKERNGIFRNETVQNSQINNNGVGLAGGKSLLDDINIDF